MFNWIKDKTYFFKKYNTSKADLTYARQTYAESISQIGVQLVENRTEIDGYRNKIDLLQKQVTKYKLQNKDLLNLINDFDKGNITKIDYIKEVRKCLK